MPCIAAPPRSWVGKSVGDGQCVAYARASAYAPAASTWKQGLQVKGQIDLQVGTVITTFDSNGQYGNRKDGTSHAAIYLRQDETGNYVLDQWITQGKPQPVHERRIRFNNAKAKRINNGDEYDVVE